MFAMVYCERAKTTVKDVIRLAPKKEKTTAAQPEKNPMDERLKALEEAMKAEEGIR